MKRFRILAAALALLCATPAFASQNSGYIPTTGTVSGLSLITQINQFFDSVMSSFSGTMAPAVSCDSGPVTGQFWLDTSSSPANVRMYDGTDWVSLGTLDTSSHLFTPAPAAVAPGITIKGSSASTYTFIDSDKGKLLNFTNSTSTAVTLPQAGSGGNFAASWTAYAKAASTGIVTITPSTSTINGASSLVLLSGQSALIIADGSNYSAIVMKLGRVESLTAGTGLTGGTITGKRYDASLNAVINSSGGGATYFPGDTYGTTATGGQYN